MAKLTDKQEAFSVKYVECNDASEAYRFAYDAENMKPQTVNVKASELLKNGKVSVRVSELKSKAKSIADEKFTISVERRLKWLEEIIKAGLDTYLDQAGNARRENLAASKGAIETLNTMLGIDERGDTKPVKVFIGVEDASKS